MRRFCLYSSFLLAALVVAPNANAQDTLKLNQTYQDVIRLNYSSGSTQIPLPPGDWILVGFGEFLNNKDYRFVTSYLVRVENKELTGIIYFSLPTEFEDVGWQIPPFCDRENVLFLERLSAYEGGKSDCWGINHMGMLPPRENTSGPYRMQYDYLLGHNIEIPPFMIMVQYSMTTSSNLLTLRYFFNPDVEGFSPDASPSWRYSDWHHHYIKAYPEKVAYIERLKSWGREWKAKVDAGFLGELEATKRLGNLRTSRTNSG